MATVNLLDWSDGDAAMWRRRWMGMAQAVLDCTARLARLESVVHDNYRAELAELQAEFKKAREDAAIAAAELKEAIAFRDHLLKERFAAIEAKLNGGQPHESKGEA